MSQIKIASFSLLKIKMPVLSVLSQIKNASFICFVADKKMPVLSSLLRIKVASFISIVTEQN